VAAKGKRAATLAGRLADGLIGVAPDRELLDAFNEAGGTGKPRAGQVATCWAETDEQARKIVREWWPNGALAGNLGSDLKMPRDIEHAAEPLSEKQAAEQIIIGPDAERHAEGIQKMLDAGYDHVYIHQVGPEQERFLEFYEREVLPMFELQPGRLGASEVARPLRTSERKAS
jgi:G6PDH family F420-dependent oxidoreductase